VLELGGHAMHDIASIVLEDCSSDVQIEYTLTGGGVQSEHLDSDW
jgi:hypothetical protein